MPLQRRVPKRGFHNPFKKRYALVNIGRLESLDAGTEVSPDLLCSRGWAKKNESVKILGKGSLSKALTVRVHQCSAQAQQKIKAAGGTVEVIGNV